MNNKQIGEWVYIGDIVETFGDRNPQVKCSICGYQGNAILQHIGDRCPMCRNMMITIDFPKPRKVEE